jgi:hypothetical protein
LDELGRPDANEVASLELRSLQQCGPCLRSDAPTYEARDEPHDLSNRTATSPAEVPEPRLLTARRTLLEL